MRKKNALQIKKMMWATDFSRDSRACLPYVKLISEKLKTQNYAAYVLPKFSDWVYEAAFVKDEELYQTIEETRAHSMQKLTAISKKNKIPLEPILMEGLASDELIEFNEKNEVNLIIAGRRGMSEIEQILIGSTASRLIRNSPIPIIIVPRSKKEVKLEKILCPIDLSEMSLTELKYAIAFARQLQARLHVIHVSEFFNYKIPLLKREQLNEKVNSKILSIAEESQYEIDSIIYKSGEPAQEIISFAKKEKFDLITMSTHQRKGIEKFFLGSITEKVLMYGDIPVLVLPPTEYE